MIVAGLAAAWIAAGSTGLLGHALRHVLTWTALGVVIAAGWPCRWCSLEGLAVLAAAAAAGLMNATTSTVINTLSAAAVLALLGVGKPPRIRHALGVVASAVAVLAVYQLMLTAVPWFWLTANWIALILGRLAGLVTSQPLAVGPTFAGLDFLILMGALYAGWLAMTPAPRGPRAIYAVLAVLGGHLAYLAVLSLAPAALSLLPAEETPGWSWAAAVRTLIPWNLPAIAAVIHLLIAAAMFGWCVDFQAESIPSGPAPLGRRRLAAVAACALAVAMPLIAALHPQPLSLNGKKVVAYKEGFLNWLKPTHGEYGRLSVGMYGMLDSYVKSLGGSLQISPDLAEQDLQDADVLILLYPNKPWAPGQMERIWSFVRGGGSLLLMADHTTRHADVPLSEGGNYANQLLGPTHVRVAFDSATFAVGGWLQTYAPMIHPTTQGIGDDRNQFGVVIGAGVEATWPAKPLLMGRFGWADPGDEGSDAAMMGNHAYDPGERLGDLVLAAEEPVGKGKLIVFGDTSSMTNGINVGAHLFTSRLLGYLAGEAQATPAWRQLGCLVLGVMLICLLARSGRLAMAGPAALCLAGSLAASTLLSAAAATILPDGRTQSPNNLAYVDTSHLPANSEESWREQGVGGLMLTLMRNGYLALNMEEFSRERLERAALLILAAPQREYSRSERDMLRRWVEQGGMLICTAGYDRSTSIRSLLRSFDLYVGKPEDAGTGTPDPEPMGHFKSPFIQVKDYMAHVRFHAAWPVGSYTQDAQALAYGQGDQPVILMQRVGKGKCVLVGDTNFATNQNLEHEGGEPFEDLRENADFWRWLLTYVTDREPWLPSAPSTQPGE